MAPVGAVKESAVNVVAVTAAGVVPPTIRLSAVPPFISKSLPSISLFPPVSFPTKEKASIVENSEEESSESIVESEEEEFKEDRQEHLF